MLGIFSCRNHVSLKIFSVHSSKIARMFQSCFAQNCRCSVMCRRNVKDLKPGMPSDRTENRSGKCERKKSMKVSRLFRISYQNCICCLSIIPSLEHDVACPQVSMVQNAKITRFHIKTSEQIFDKVWFKFL